MASELPDFTTMTDPEFLAERKRVREQLERTPGLSADRTRLGMLYDAMNEEFIRRARAAWSAATTQSAPAQPAKPNREHPRRNPMDDDLHKRLLAIEVLLEEPDDISDGLEAELYALRDKLRVVALSNGA